MVSLFGSVEALAEKFADEIRQREAGGVAHEIVTENYVIGKLEDRKRPYQLTFLSDGEAWIPPGDPLREILGIHKDYQSVVKAIRKLDERYSIEKTLVDPRRNGKMIIVSLGIESPIYSNARNAAGRVPTGRTQTEWMPVCEIEAPMIGENETPIVTPRRQS